MKIYTIYIFFKKNNIIASIININNEILTTLSAGKCGFKNTQKTTPFACSIILDKIIKFIKVRNIKIINLKFKGISVLKTLIISKLYKNNIIINTIIESTTYPYNGNKKKKNTKLLLNEKILQKHTVKINKFKKSSFENR